MEFVDTHCHVHESEFADKFKITTEDILSEARSFGVKSLICVGTTLKGSREGAEFVKKYSNTYASAALHPHEVEKLGVKGVFKEFEDLEEFVKFNIKSFVAIGECGLDYFYHESQATREAQKTLLRKHINLALSVNLPMIFHIRDGFDDFFAIFDEYLGKGSKIEGVVHSFSATKKELEGALERGLFIGLNGIMTFTNDQVQLEAAKAVPLGRLLIETDAPFLTPKPFRGTICLPKHVVVTAEFLSDLRGESLEKLSAATTRNAKELFKL